MSLSALTSARVATCLVFLVCGASMASWAPMVPFAKMRLGLSDADLGLVLLGLGGGAMVTMPLSGLLINRLGSRVVILGAVLLHSVMLPALALAGSAVALGVFLFVFGCGIGAVDVAMNAQAVVIEQRAGRPIMSFFHGLFSVGGIVGALGVSLLLEAGLSLVFCACVIAVGAVGLVIFQYPRLLPRSADHRIEGTRWTFPPASVVFLGALCFVAFLAEGAILDWSAVYLKFFRDFSASSAGLGYAVFSVAMAAGRLTGDAVAHRLGPVPTMRWGAFTAAVGFCLVVAAPWWQGPLVGFLLIGLGLANVVPLLFSAAGRRGHPSVTIPAITTLGYAGLLAGPALIGLVAAWATLPVALGVIGGLLMGVMASARVVRM